MKLVQLHDGSGAPFLMNTQFIVSISSDHDEQGNPILGRYVMRTNVVDITPQGPRPAAYQIRESVEDVQKLVAESPEA